MGNMVRTVIVDDIRDVVCTLCPGQATVSLHAPVFQGREQDYLAQCVDSTFVSGVWPFNTRLKETVRDYIGAAHVVATVNVTAARAGAGNFPEWRPLRIGPREGSAAGTLPGQV